jgi:hypothetical protein
VTPKEMEKATEFLSRREAPRAEEKKGEPAAAGEVALARLCLVLLNANEFVFPD